MKLSLSVLLFLLQCNDADAFVPQSFSSVQGSNNLLSNRVRPIGQPRDFSLSNERLIVDPVDPREDISNNFQKPKVSGDIIADGLLESISNTRPEDVLAEVTTDKVESILPEEYDIPVLSVSDQLKNERTAEAVVAEVNNDISDHVKSIFDEQSNDLDTEEVMPSQNNILSGVEYADFGNSTLSEDVKAVLHASSEAVAAVEASLPKDLMDQLDLPSAVVSNSTISSGPIEVNEIPEILTAASVVGEPATSNKVDSPKVSQILKFAVPAIGVWLCGPLLSLIDTSAVGLFSGTIQQAALNPAVAVTDYAALLIAFMYTGSTNLIAAAQEKDRGSPDKPVTAKTLIGALKLSTYVGTGLGVILFAFARPLLQAIIGNGDVSPAVFTAAMKYVRIRALGMPAAAVIGTAQSACLGMKDIRSPLYVLVAAAVVNFFGDMLFVGSSHPLIGGAAGAAWATVFSQLSGVALFVHWLCNKPESKPKVLNVSKAILELTGKPTSDGHGRREQLKEDLQSFPRRNLQNKKSSLQKIRGIFRRDSSRPRSTPNTDENFSVRGFLQDRFSYSDLLKPPTKETRKDFSPYLVPVTTTQVGRVSGYVAMSHVVASSLGTVSMAAQQIIVSLFYCLCPIADSLSLTAQSFVPAISEKRVSKERTLALRKTSKNFIKAGVVFGGAMMAAVSAIPLLSGFFTSDTSVVTMVNSVVPLLLAFFGVHGALCSAEGLLLGQKDLNFLGKMYGAFFAAVPYLMLRVKKAALSGSQSVGLTSVWNVFVGYQMVRFVAWMSRVMILQRRTTTEARKAGYIV